MDNDQLSRRHRGRAGHFIDSARAKDEGAMDRARAEKAGRQRAVDEDPMLRDEEERRSELPR
jgi:hypothetical protein